MFISLLCVGNQWKIMLWSIYLELMMSTGCLGDPVWLKLSMCPCVSEWCRCCDRGDIWWRLDALSRHLPCEKSVTSGGSIFSSDSRLSLSPLCASIWAQRTNTHACICTLQIDCNTYSNHILWLVCSFNETLKIIIAACVAITCSMYACVCVVINVTTEWRFEMFSRLTLYYCTVHLTCSWVPLNSMWMEILADCLQSGRWRILQWLKI